MCFLAVLYLIYQIKLNNTNYMPIFLFKKDLKWKKFNEIQQRLEDLR